MTITALYTPLMFEEKAEENLSAAAVLANLFSAHLIGSHIRQPVDIYPPLAYYPLASESLVDAIERSIEDDNEVVQKLRDVFDDVCRDRGLKIIPLTDAPHTDGPTASWSDDVGVVPWALASGARMSDLIVLPHLGPKANMADIAVFEAMLTESGRPILVCAEERKPEVPQSAVVAWNGGIEAARALSAGVPFLEKMRQVAVVTVGDIKKNDPTTDDAAEFLQRHNVRATAHNLSRTKDSEGDQILDIVRERNADLLVMGAYSHNRWREIVFGGVTQTMVRRASVALLVMH